MTKEETIFAKNREFFDAVDIVCMECIEASEEKCSNCPVRKTCDSKLDAEEEN